MSTVRYRVPSAAGKRIKKLREEKGMTQRDLQIGAEGDFYGVGYAYISRVENGSRTPSMGVLIPLAEKLGTTAYFLITGKERPSRTRPCPCCGARA